MSYIVRPVEGLRPLPNRSKQHGLYLRELLEWRTREIEVFWERLAGELKLDRTRRARADEAVVRLPAVGMLVIPEWLEELERLKRFGWLRVWRDYKLPPGWVAQPATGSGAAQAWHLDKINVPSGWTGNGVTVGVIDSGYDPTFEDLNGTFVATFAKYVDPPANSSAAGSMVTVAPFDSASTRHGSKVCSMLAGKTCGVSPNAKVLVGAMKDFGVDATAAMMIVALEWLLTYTHTNPAHPDRPYGCDVITTSLATGEAGDSDPNTEIALAIEGADAFNTLVIAAIGNASTNDGLDAFRSPGTGQTVIGVGAVDDQLQVADFSAFGTTDQGINKPDIVAPGEALEFPTANGGKEVDWGTSFAAPIVAGAAALVLEKYPLLREDVVQLRQKLLSLNGGTAYIVNVPAAGKGPLDLTNL